MCRRSMRTWALQFILKLLLAAWATGGAGAAAESAGGATCFNQLRRLATHNSYHVAPDPLLIDRVLSIPIVAAGMPDGRRLAKMWEYTHLPLDQQLDMGVRGFEIDVHADPEGGLYSAAAGLRLAGVNGYRNDSELFEPGFKVFHVPDFDFGSTCLTFRGCLRTIQGWSDAHPDHLPIVIHLESKRPLNLTGRLGSNADALVKIVLDTSSAPGPDRLATTPELNITLLAALEEEILEVFDRGALITPDDVRGGDPSVDLKELLLVDPASGTCPWPDLNSMRGKVMFVFLPRSEILGLYEELHPQAEGALLWLSGGRSAANQSHTVFYSGASWGLDVGQDIELPTDVSDVVAGMSESVRAMVQRGYIARGRADADTFEARLNFTDRRDAMWAAGAHLVTTDYPLPSDIFPSTYEVIVPGREIVQAADGADGMGGGPVAVGQAAAAAGLP